MSDRIEVLPLSPARQCARSCSLGIARPLLDGDAGGNSLAVDQSRHDADLLVHVFARAAATARPVGVQSFDLLSYSHCPFRGRGTPRSEEHTSELQSRPQLVCRLLLEKKKKNYRSFFFKKKKKKKQKTQ